MTLVELLAHATDWTDDDTTIYAEKPWRCGSEAILVSPSPNTTEPVEQDGRSYDYFLETFIAREFMEHYERSQEGAEASADQRCERLIGYAINDA